MTESEEHALNRAVIRRAILLLRERRDAMRFVIGYLIPFVLNRASIAERVSRLAFFDKRQCALFVIMSL